MSLRMALGQTVEAVEVLVVEDGRDTASKQVVASFDDPRVRSLRLLRRSGSQAKPNNRGWAQARGSIIAYLGHDDLWQDDHLESLIPLFGDGADLAHSGSVFIGPPPEGRIELAGGEAWNPSTWVPPSSFAHLRDSPRLPKWVSHMSTGWPIDHAFLLAAEERGARVMASERTTVLKFPAAWRPGIYRTLDASLQAGYFERLQLQPRLAEAIASDARERGVKATVKAPPHAAPGHIARVMRKRKGAD